MHIQKMINTFHKNHLEKLIAMFPLSCFALRMARPTIKSKQKIGRGKSVKSAKQAKKAQFIRVEN